ncbi:MAG: prolipoprotein diacylglyceryl transferase [Spirochaetales bacterium]|nr:prolipoprotein diacylglyceryl transferase [Spirochaetales bacterium]
MNAGSRINTFFDFFSNPVVSFFKMKIPSFLFCGITSFLAGSVCFILLSFYLRLTIEISIVIIGICIAIFFLFSFLYEIVTGKEEYVFFMHLFISYITVILFLGIVKYPVFPYLDAFSYGIAIFIAIGRIGCLKAGCCYGRPFYRGISYSPVYRNQGIPVSYINKRLFPVQYIEFSIVLFIWGSGIFLILPYHSPGTSVTYFLCSYSLARFFLEFIRGDVIRKYIFLLSLNQWICILLVSLLVVLQSAGILPFSLHIVIYSVFCLFCLFIVTVKIHLPYNQTSLTHPAHMLEIASIIDSFPDLYLLERFYTKEDIWLKETSKGLIISKGIIPHNEKYKINYTFSHRSFLLSPSAAKKIRKLILSIIGAPRNTIMYRGNKGVYHIIL